MDGQMTIFDFLKDETDFRTMPKEEVINILCQRTGIKLVYDNYLQEYSCKIGKVKITADIETYLTSFDDDGPVKKGNKFIGVSWSHGTSGGSSPCDSIDEAVEFIQRHKRGG